MSTEYDPMSRWFELARSQGPLNHYQLLGLELFESRPEVIEAAATRITLFLQNLADGSARDQAERLLQDVAAAQLCLLGPAKKAAYDAQLRADPDANDGQQAPADDPANPPEIAPLIKVETTQTASRGKGKQTGRRRDSGTFVPPPDFGPIGPTADGSVQAPGPAEAAVPIVEVRPAPVASARKRTGQRRPDPITLPGEINLDQSPRSAAETEAPAATTETAAIQICADGRGGDKRQAAKRSAAKRPAAPRNLTAGRRKPSVWGWLITIAACGGSAAAVVALLVYLLGQPPVASRPTARQAAPSATPQEALPAMNSQPAAKPQDTHEPKAATATRTTPRPPRPTTEQGGVREYSKQEVTQRRQGIDSFAAMAQSEATRLHRDEPPGMSQNPQPPQVSRPVEVPVAITEGLLAHWSFEEKSPAQAIDDSPHVRPANLDGRPVSIADGSLGLALRFDGQDDCLRVPDGMLKGAAGTISFWLRTSDMTEPKYFLGSAGPGAVICLRLQAGQLIAGGGRDAGSKPISAAAPQRSKGWQHVALTWKSGGEVVLYVGGRPVGRQTAAQLLDPTGVVMGKDEVSGTYSAFDADEIRLFSRALSPEEVTELAER